MVESTYPLNLRISVSAHSPTPQMFLSSIVMETIQNQQEQDKHISELDRTST